MVTCVSVAGLPPVQGKVLCYGIIGVRGDTKEITVKSPETLSGFSRRSDREPILLVPTNRIPAKIGVRFGMKFEISDVPEPDGLAQVTVIVRYPPITKPDGTVSVGFKRSEEAPVKKGKVTGWWWYSFDHDYELVTGDWEIEIQFRGQKICSQTFKVFKE